MLLALASPYLPSPVIERVEFDFSTHKRFAPGSDNWPTTWADDGHLYAAWGDGGGFGGDNKKGRVTLGVARIEGDAASYTGHNVWGGFNAAHPAQFDGKSYGMLSVGGVLYMWVSHQPNPHLDKCQLAFSKDHGATWQLADWCFRYTDQLTVPTFLNFGCDYAGARDGYVYSYFIHPAWGPGKSATGNYGFDVHKPGRVCLSRVPKEAILDRNRHEFFAGLAKNGAPKWSAKLSDKQPVFQDANGVGWNLSVSFNPGLRRYLLVTEHGETHAGKFGLFDAPEPWGPWTTVAYEDRWGEGHVEVSTFYWNFPTKWLSADGARFTLVFTGKNSNDSWNTVDGRFIRRASDYFPPPDSEGGWRTRPNDARFDAAFEFAKRTTKNGGLLVLHRGWLVYERYFGRAHHEANPVNASIAKSFTSIAIGILLHERPELFPDGLDQQVFTPRYFPVEMFPLSDPRKADIKLGQLLAMTAGIRGNNPGSMVNHQPVTLTPAGPDGQVASTDAMAFGQMDGKLNARTLWCEPGGGYSYATASIHLGSVMLRHVTGRELKDYVDEKIARPLGWGRWEWRDTGNPHTPGGGNIAPRPTDLLRFGYLLLREGRWRDRQIVPADYVRHCARPSPYNPHYDYSLQFDVNGNGHWSDVPRDAFWKSGSGGHVLYIVPSLDLVVYKMGGRDSQYARSRPSPTPDSSRENWKEDRALDYETAKHETLKLIITALDNSK